MLKTRRDVYNFRGAYAPPAVASRIGRFCSKITKTSGTPTVQSVNGGTMDLALTADSEVQNLCLYQGDILPYKVQDLMRVEFLVALTASFPAACSCAFGVTNARNDAFASITNKALFRVPGGAQAVLVDTADGTITNTGVATGLVIPTTLTRFIIDFTGVQTRQLPSASLGNRANVTFFEDKANADGSTNLRQVCKNTLFDMSNMTGTNGLQLFAQLQKTSGTAVATLSIESIEVEYKVR